MTTTTTPPSAPAPAPAGDALQAGKAPVGTGASPLFAQLVALGFVVLGVVTVRDLLVHVGAITGTSWLGSVVDAADGIDGGEVLVAVVGVVAVLLGLLLLPVVFRRRPRKGLALKGTTGSHLTPRDLERVTKAVLEDADSVSSIKVKASRRRLKVRATVIGAKDRNRAVTDDLTERLAPTLSAFERAPRTSVTIRNEDHA